MNPDKQYLATHPHRLLLDGDASVFLKLTSSDDSEQLYALVHENRAHLSKYQRWAKDVNFEQMHEAVQASVRKIAEDGWLQYRIMVPGPHEHRMVGTITLYNRDLLNGTAYLSYWLAEAEQGKGYARRAAQRLLQYAVPAWRLRQIFIEMDPANERGIGLAKRLGAQPTDQYRTEEIDDETVTWHTWMLTVA